MHCFRQLASGRALVGILMALALASCGGDDDPTGPGSTDLVGNWTLDLTGDDGTGGTCDISNTTLTFVETGNTVEGTATFGGAGAIVCNPGGTVAFDGTTPLESLGQSGDDVEFSYTSNAGTSSFSGSFDSSGDTMSGTVTFFLNFTSGTTQFDGTWTATRK